MKITIELSKEDVARILAYELVDRDLPETMNRAEIHSTVVTHFLEASAYCQKTFERKNEPHGWAEDIVRRSRIR